MKLLQPLTGGVYAMVDDEDHRAWSGYKWGSKQGYVCADFRMPNGKVRRFYLHRLIAKPAKGQQVHHKNRCRWDNRKENLECLSVEEHSRRHPYGKRLANLAAKIREAEMMWVREQEFLARIQFAEERLKF